MNEVLELQALPIADEVAGLKRKCRRASRGSKTVCLVSLDGSANGLTANVLNIFGGAF